MMSKMAFKIVIVAMIVNLQLITARQYIISPSFEEDSRLRQEYGIKNLCDPTLLYSSATCIGKHSYVSGCLGQKTFGAYNSLPNSATNFDRTLQTVKNRTCIDAGSDTLLMLPSDRVPSLFIGKFKHFVLDIFCGSSSPTDFNFGVYFVNHHTKLFEPVNITYNTTGGSTHSVNGSSGLYFYFRSDDNSSTGQPQDTTFDVHLEVRARHKLTVYCKGTYIQG